MVTGFKQAILQGQTGNFQPIILDVPLTAEQRQVVARYSTTPLDRLQLTEAELKFVVGDGSDKDLKVKF
jgi:hypothetical protein